MTLPPYSPSVSEGNWEVAAQAPFYYDQNVRPLQGVERFTGGTSVTLVEDYGTGYATWIFKIGYREVVAHTVMPAAETYLVDTGARANYTFTAEHALDIGDGEFEVVTVKSSYGYPGGGYYPWRAYVYRFRRENGGVAYKGRTVTDPLRAVGLYPLLPFWAGGDRYFVVQAGDSGIYAGSLTRGGGSWDRELMGPVSGGKLLKPGRPVTTPAESATYGDNYSLSTSSELYVGDDMVLLKASCYYYSGPAIYPGYGGYVPLYVTGEGYVTLRRNGAGDWQVLDNTMAWVEQP
jgi:hypothetical protein